jgi:subtilisin family serine protease
VGELKFYQTFIVIAAGNFNERREALLSAWPNILVVGATGLNAATSLCSYSGYGSGVDIAVPAGEIDDGLATVDSLSDAHRLFNGTSAAVPVVSAQAALLKEKYRGASANFIKEKILNNSQKIDTLNVAGGRLLSYNRWHLK